MTTSDIDFLKGCKAKVDAEADRIPKESARALTVHFMKFRRADLIRAMKLAGMHQSATTYEAMAVDEVACDIRTLGDIVTDAMWKVGASLTTP
jgi:hypothetical protein